MSIFGSSIAFMMTHSKHIILHVRELVEIRLSKVCLKPVFFDRGRQQPHVWKLFCKEMGIYEGSRKVIVFDVKLSQ